MKLTLKNDAGLVRKIPTGLSWTGFIFTGFTMMTRGMVGKGLVYLLIIYSIQTMMVIASAVTAVANGERSGNQAFAVYMLLLSIPNFIFLFKLNKWTARHWLDRGYKPEGPGWVQWGPKFGVQISEEVKAASVGIKDEPLFNAKDILGFVFAAIFIVILIAQGGSAPTARRGPDHEKDQQQAEASNDQAASLHQVVTFDDSKWVLLDAKNLGAVVGRDSTSQKRTTGKFIWVVFNVTNTTSEEEMVLYTPTLQDSKNRVFKEMDEQELYSAEGAETMISEQLPAGLKKTFQAIYEVPADATGLCFQARSLADQGDAKPIATGL